VEPQKKQRLQKKKTMPPPSTPNKKKLSDMLDVEVTVMSSESSRDKNTGSLKKVSSNNTIAAAPNQRHSRESDWEGKEEFNVVFTTLLRSRWERMWPSIGLIQSILVIM
jgi:hypothetical protein